MASPLGVEGRETLITLVETDDKYPNTSVGGSEHSLPSMNSRSFHLPELTDTSTFEVM